MNVDRAAYVSEGEGQIEATPRKNNAPDLQVILQRYFQLDLETLADAIALARVERVTLDAFLLSRG